MMVVGAEQGRIVDGRFSALGPRGEVVCFRPCSGDGAPVGPAGLVAEPERDALGAAVESSGASQVEDFGLPAQYGGEEASVAGESAGLSGGEGRLPVAGKAVVEGSVADPGPQRLEVDGDDHGGCGAAVHREPCRVDGLENEAKARASVFGRAMRPSGVLCGSGVLSAERRGFAKAFR